MHAASKSLNYLKLLTHLRHFPLKQQHLQRLTLLKIGRSRVRCEDEEIFILLFHLLYALVKIIEIV